MALSNVSNLSALDAVANIGAGGETTIIKAVQTLISRFSQDDVRLTGLFVGQMQAEGFTVATGVIYVVQSPTVKVEVLKGDAGQLYVQASLYVNSAWQKLVFFPLYVL